MNRLLEPAQAISVEEFRDLMGLVVPPVSGGLAVAVSGGPDSMALAYLTARWCEAEGQPLPQAFIVDHALRAESGEEAELVRQRLQAMGLLATILRWEHEPVVSGVHRAAREARYRLLLQACRAAGLYTLLFAHQREDQAETVLMRFAKGTGIDGLAGIAGDSVSDGVRILRPVLTVAKARLVATCEVARISFVTDPSNEHEKFARGRLRQVMPLLEQEGLTVDRLVDFGARAREAREALDYYVSEFLVQFCEADVYGAVSLSVDALLKLPRAVSLRVLVRVLQFVHADDYPPQHAALSQLLDGLAQPDMPMRTLHGCVISRNAEDVLVAREPGVIGDECDIGGGESLIWDGRWHVSLAPEAGAQRYIVKPLGHPPHDELDRLAPGLRQAVPQGRVRAGLPALWHENRIVFVPFFCPQNFTQATFVRLSQLKGS